MSFGLPMGAMYLCNTIRPAQDAADETSLPMTVFYHRDHGHNFTESTARILKDKRNTTLFVTWLPSNYFERGEQS